MIRKTVVPLPPPRVRKEPPTLAEAVEAARGLTDDLGAQVEIAAGLMGVSEDEVRPLVTPMPKALHIGNRAVVVERRSLARRRA